MTKTTLLIAERFSLEAQAFLQSTGEFELISSPIAKLEKSQLDKISGLIIRSQSKIDASLIEKMPHLKVIVTATSGFDHIDLTATRQRGIQSMYVPEGNAISAAELSWALLLACSRKLIPAHLATSKNNWDRHPLLGRELSGLQLGIIGLGRVGRLVAQYAHAFQMKVQYYDPYLSENLRPDYAHSTSLIELLRSSEVISLHVPLTKQTRNLINRNTLEHVNLSPILINTSRGSVIDSEDLLFALQKGIISAAGLDVFSQEPLDKNSPLINHPQIVHTPHIGATTNEAFERASLGAAQKILAFFKQGVTSDLLPDSIPWLEQSFTLHTQN